MKSAALAFLMVCCTAISASWCWFAIVKSKDLGFMARPDPTVPNHTRDIPLLGGVGVMLAAAAGIALSGLDGSSCVGLWIGLGTICVLGAYKDRVGKPVNPWLQMGVQAIAALSVVAAIGAPRLTSFVTIDFALAVVMGIALMNAVNFLDVMDGLAAGTCMFAFAGVAVAGSTAGPDHSVVVAVGTASGLLGFLVFNVHPARIFMGDIGSFGTGLMLFAMLIGMSKAMGIGTCALLAGIPIAELAASSIMRIAVGSSIFAGDGRHLSLVMLRHGWRVRTIVGTFWLAEIACCGAAIVLSSRK
jgi:UDP-N-acetylmuramyl pentapeptide phosphotransferase/UDP-N-acetylglucosamine-1-phosphate transferase